jgi:ketopantoate reductase
MKKPVVVVGMGEMGGVFARGFLRAGYPVYPVVRGMTMEEEAKKITDPECVVIAVAEADLHSVLKQVPEAWRDRLVLLQNELLPNDWLQYELDPTVISVWFEKKKGMDAKVIIPSPVFGAHAELIAQALGSIDIATTVLENGEALLFELVLKNVYILTTNIAGLQTGGNVGELWADHQEVALAVAREVIKLQEALTGQTLDFSLLIEGMVKAFDGDLQHGCMGRSAPVRLERALALAREHGLQLETLNSISVSSAG